MILYGRSPLSSESKNCLNILCNCTMTHYTVSEILALISQNFKRSRDPKCTPCCRSLKCVMPVLSVFSLQTNLKCLASSASEIWPGPRNVEMVHVTLTTATWGQLITKKLILHVTNSCTKFEVCSSSYCTYISGGKL